jgi:hypothetical protein
LIAPKKSWALGNVRQQRKDSPVTSFDTITDTACTDHLPRPDQISEQNHSNTALPLPKPSMPNVNDSGRISFGAAMRLPAVR